ncbi:Hsp20/alpha crystallin family protein [Endozoicomonas sp. Mp262]|uniref:Hsp20/alpha crystallin family protein n=1 Tax=Endozoicomonas sp. Mp262 TaxID=2919499 RepID=UPI0021D8154F
MDNKWSTGSWLKPGNDKLSDDLTSEAVSPVSQLRRGLDKLFDKAFSGSSLEVGVGDEYDGFHLNLDIQEQDSQYKIIVEVPGMDEKELEVYIEGDLLTIKGEKLQDSVVGKANMHRVGRRCGSFCRAFSLPDNVEQNSISANFNKGVLTLKIDKRKDIRSSARQIKINKE